MTADWASFTTRLTVVLSRLCGEDQRVLIVSDVSEPQCYVQFLGADAGLAAEVVSNRFLPAPRRFSRCDERALLDAGWHRPGGRWFRAGHSVNWTCSAGPADARRLADRSLVALRDALRVGTPDDLRYRAFQSRGTACLEYPELGLPHETA